MDELSRPDYEEKVEACKRLYVSNPHRWAYGIHIPTCLEVVVTLVGEGDESILATGVPAGEYIIKYIGQTKFAIWDADDFRKKFQIRMPRGFGF